MIENKRTKFLMNLLAHTVLLIVSFSCLIPFLIIISASFSTESSIVTEGYGIFPKELSLEAYKMVMKNPVELRNAYVVTVFVTIVGSFLSILMTALAAYPLSRNDYKWKKSLNFYFYFTMLFSGGAIPSYILISKYLNMKNNIWVLIIPILMNVGNVFLLRTYFNQIPKELIEASKIDGAGEIYTFFKIIIPMSVTGLATILVIISLRFWNEWYQCLMFMSNEKIISLQYFLYRTMSNIDAILKDMNSSAGAMVDLSNLPSETARMAMCVLAAGPMVFVFAFFQKYFVRGINVGSVKG